MNLSDTERAALASLTGALGTVLVMDVTATPVAPEAISGPSSVRTGTCRGCGTRRDLDAHTSMAATAADLCFRCGSDRAQGLGECTSKPRTCSQTFGPGDWDAP